MKTSFILQWRHPSYLGEDILHTSVKTSFIPQWRHLPQWLIDKVCVVSNAKHACRHPALTGRSGTPSSDLPTNERQRLFTSNRRWIDLFQQGSNQDWNPKQLIDGRFTNVFSVTLLCLRFTIRMCLWTLFYGPIQVLTLSIYHFGERFYAFGYDNSASLTRLPLPTLSFARIHFKNDRIELWVKSITQVWLIVLPRLMGMSGLAQAQAPHERHRWFADVKVRHR